MADAQALLMAMVKGLTPEHFQVQDEPIKGILGHGLFQGVVAAVTRLNPDVDRSALLAGSTWTDVFAWLRASEGEQARAVDRSGRLPRGSYQSVSARLRPISPADVDALYSASLDPRASHRWRFRGRTPGPAEFGRLLFGHDVLCQFMVVELDSGAAVGLISAYDVDLVAGHVKVAAQRLPAEKTPSTSKGLMFEGFFIFAQYLFDHFALTKLILEVPEYNLSLLDTGQRTMLRLEGCLKSHYYYGDRYWDHYFLALYRSEWEEIADMYRGDWPEGHFAHNDLASDPGSDHEGP